MISLEWQPLHVHCSDISGPFPVRALLLLSIVITSKVDCSYGWSVGRDVWKQGRTAREARWTFGRAGLDSIPMMSGWKCDAVISDGQENEFFLS